MELKITIELSDELSELLHRLIDAIEGYEDDDQDESDTTG